MRLRHSLKKVLFVDHDFGFSGATVSLKYIVKFFTESGIQVYVLTPKNPRDQECFTSVGARCTSSLVFNRDFLRLGLHFTDKQSIPTLKGMIFLGKEIARVFLGMVLVCRTIIRIRPDLVYANEYVSIQASIAGKLLGKMTAVHIRSPFLRGTFGIRRRLLAKTIVACNDVVFAITPFEADQIKPYTRRCDNIEVVGEFLNQENFQASGREDQIRSQLKLPDNRKIVIMLGGIYKIKGTLDFLLSAEIVLRATQIVHFVVAGKEYMFDPAYLHECRRISSLHVMQNKVTLLGEIHNQIDLIDASCILVSSNTETHFSRPIIEAWARNRPVVATNTMHNQALVDNRVDGIVVSMGNHQEMADAILRLIHDDKLAAGMGKNGYEKAKKQFDASVNIGKIFACCQKIMRHDRTTM